MRTWWLVSVCWLGLAHPSVAGPTRADAAFAIHSFGVADGLPHERVNCVMQDRRGWIWLGTWEGVALFDGRAFRTFDTRAGLPNPLVNTLVEDAHGHVFAGTNGGGIARLLVDPKERAVGAPARFVAVRLGPRAEDNTVDVLHVDARDRLWCGAQTGLYRAQLVDGTPGPFETVIASASSSWVTHAARDRRGRTWFANDDELVAVDDDQVERIPLPAGAPSRRVVGLAIDAQDRPLLATREGLLECAHDADGAVTWSTLPVPERLATIRALLVAGDGAIWIGTQTGVVRSTADGSTVWLRDEPVYALEEDRDGNVWAGTWSSGVSVLVPSAVRSFTMADGLPNRSVLQIVAGGNGRIVCTTEGGAVEIDHDHMRFVEGSKAPPFDALGMRLAQASDGTWWIGTASGLWSSPGPSLDLSRARALAFATDRSATSVYGRILTSARDGEIVFGGEDSGIYTLDERAPDATCQAISPLPVKWSTPIRELVRQGDGTLWLLPYTGLHRRRNGVFEDVGALCGMPDLQPRCMCEDRRSRLWLGTRTDGLHRIDEPSSDHPHIERVAGRDELGTGTVWSICEDPRGNLWLGTGHGLVRYEPDARNVTVFTMREGLAGDIVAHCVCAADGRVWAATSNGLSVIDPMLERARAPAPATYLTRMRIAGSEVPLPEAGVTSLASIELEPDQNDIDVAFASPVFGNAIRWQHRLRADAPWSVPESDAHVQFAQLAAGSYRFEVRSVTSAGDVGTESAGFALTVLPAVWQRPWFLALAATALGMGAWMLHRARLNRVLALERIRSQIASDLHDDLGAGLAQIAILSEVAHRDPDSRGHLVEIAGLARAMRESVGEIVWAIDPRKDKAGDLVRRVRQTAFNLLESEGVDVTLRAPPEATLDRVGLAPDQRRHLLLIAKEALTNVARHADATHVAIDIALAGSVLTLTIEDDGRGFDERAPRNGHGLASLKRRADALGARLSLRSAPGEGLCIELVMPVARPHDHAVARERVAE